MARRTRIRSTMKIPQLPRLAHFRFLIGAILLPPFAAASSPPLPRLNRPPGTGAGLAGALPAPKKLVGAAAAGAVPPNEKPDAGGPAGAAAPKLKGAGAVGVPKVKGAVVTPGVERDGTPNGELALPPNKVGLGPEPVRSREGACSEDTPNALVETGAPNAKGAGEAGVEAAPKTLVEGAVEPKAKLGVESDAVVAVAKLKLPPGAGDCAGDGVDDPKPPKGEEILAADDPKIDEGAAAGADAPKNDGAEVAVPNGEGLVPAAVEGADPKVKDGVDGFA